MSVEKDIAEIIVKKVAATTVAEYLLPANISRDALDDIGISLTQYQQIRVCILESRISSILGGIVNE